MTKQDDPAKSDALIMQPRGVLATFLPELMPAAVVGLFVLALLYTLYLAAGLFIPVLLAMFLSIVFRPVVRWMQRLRVPAHLAAICLTSLLLAGLIGGAAMVIGPAADLVERLPRIQTELEIKLWPVKKSLEDARKASEKIEKITSSESKGQPATVVRGPTLAERIVDYTGGTITQALITLVLLYFFLAEGRNTIERAIKRMPWEKHRNFAILIVENIQARISSYLQTLFLIAVGLGLTTGIALAIVGMPDPVFWGVFAGAMVFLPYLGPLVVLVALTGASVLEFDTAWAMALPPLIYAVLTAIEGYFITPSILGRRLTLGPINVFLSMLFWTWLWGIPGALLSVPILACLQIAGYQIMKAQKEKIAENGNHEMTASTG